MQHSTCMPKARLGVLMWLIGMIGVFSILLLLPGMLANRSLSLSIWVLVLIQLVQSGVILALAVWIGIILSVKVGLSSPCMEALVTKHSFINRLRSQLVPGSLGGLAVGILLTGMNYITPYELIVPTQNLNPVLKVIAEVLYGGVTEEILLRWGLMTLILWLLWRFIQCNNNNPSLVIVWTAILVSALLFALGHLPAAHILAGHLTPHIVIYVIGGNTLAGVVFGYLYQRFGLESAILAHGSAHIVADLLIFATTIAVK